MIFVTESNISKSFPQNIEFLHFIIEHEFPQLAKEINSFGSLKTSQVSFVLYTLLLAKGREQI